MIPNLRKYLAPFLIVTLLLVTSCAQQPASRYEGAQKDSTEGPQRNQTIAKEATQGSQFNKFFPKSSDGYERVYTQEKKGFSQAVLKQEGKEIAKLSISDTVGNEIAKKKFEQSSQAIKPQAQRNKNKDLKKSSDYSPWNSLTFPLGCFEIDHGVL